jgi:hypothetical protein
LIVDTTTMKIVEVFTGELGAMSCGGRAHSLSCTTDADCQKCQGVCADLSAYCKTNADCSGSSCGACGDVTACTSDTDCMGKTCNTFSFWQTFEAHLDKSRPGCSVK